MTGALLYLMALAAAELVVALVNPVGGMVFHVVILFSLILYSSFSKHSCRKLYLALALAPLIRIISLSMPLSRFSPIYWYLIVAVPLFVAILVAMRSLDFRPSDVGLTLRRSPLQGLVALTGIGFGWVEYNILKPDPLVSHLTLGEVILPALILLVASGFVEELVFRGVMQRSAEEALGSWGWLYVAGIYSLLYIGWLSAAQWFFILLVGLFFGWVVRRTGSLMGVTLSHGIANVLLYLVLPLVAH
jgi:membrane protease YdiL (CAAX protease family)